jgi:hypothetical protein
MTRARIYGKVKAAVVAAYEAGLTVNQAADLHGLCRRSVRSTADRLGLKLKPIRAPRRQP